MASRKTPPFCFSRRCTIRTISARGVYRDKTDNDIWYLLGYCARQQGHHDEAQRYFTRATRGGSSLDAGRYYNDQPVDYLFWQGMAAESVR
ncbi:TPR-domain protein [Citrobacter koseri]|uniref:TPR-domain protein n=1 Tax=Citrobacter koseri TaxID=545 RepID=A0A2X2VSF8_CITKO|nr:TPR-domain protein [Citrobacter koseri]